MSRLTFIYACAIAFALPLSPDAVRAQTNEWLDRGMSEYGSGQYMQAVNSLSMAVNKNPDSDLSHYLLANSLMRIGHKARALQEYEKACNLSHTMEMYRNCAQMLQAYKVSVPPPPPSALGGGRPRLDEYQVSSLTHINALAEQKTDRGHKLAESHQGGLEVFKCSPENSAELKPQWDKWIENFRLTFGSTLGKQLRGGSVGSVGRLSGRALMVFSVDKNRRLRGRIVKSDAPVLFNYYLLETTRMIDRASVLDFPQTSLLPGYNFTMTWDYGASRAGGDTLAELLRTEAAIRSQAMLARARGLSGAGTDVTGSLTSNMTDAMLIPSFDTKVSAQILRPTELKATPGKLK